MEQEKIEASKERIIDSAERLHLLGGSKVVFHPGFYQKRDKEMVYRIIRDEILDLQETIKKNGWNVMLAPETTGKPTQFGDLDEIIRLTQDTGCSMTVDFAHLKARNNGKIDYEDTFRKLKGLGQIHAHFSGIEFSEKGERKHLLLQDKEIKDLLGLIKKHKMDVNLICESPDPFGDAVRIAEIAKDM